MQILCIHAWLYGRTQIVRKNERQVTNERIPRQLRKLQNPQARYLKFGFAGPGWKPSRPKAVSSQLLVYCCLLSLAFRFKLLKIFLQLRHCRQAIHSPSETQSEPSEYWASRGSNLRAQKPWAIRALFNVAIRRHANPEVRWRRKRWISRKALQRLLGAKAKASRWVLLWFRRWGLDQRY